MENPDRMIRHFLKISELGSLSKAADFLGVTQSGLSRSLSALEHEIGKPLFFRNGRGVELTFAGKKLVEAAKPAYFSIDAALEAIRDRVGVSEGEVRVAVIHTLSYYFMADIVAAFLGRHPDVNLALMGRSSSEVVALVEGRKADLGFVYDSAVDAECIKSAPLFEDEMCIISSAQDNLPDELDLNATKLKAVAFPDHYALGRMLQSSSVDLEIVARAETVDAILRLVSARVGICILPERIPERLLADYGLRKIRIIRPQMSRLVVAIMRKDKPASPLVDNLVQIAQASLGSGKV
jgi:DNA-binding transcriptional LysR family regulator